MLAERPNRSSGNEEGGDHDNSSVSQQQQQQLQASFSSSPDQYVVKKHDFECKEEDGVAISTRLNHILHWHPNDARHWYLRNSSAN